MPVSELQLAHAPTDSPKTDNDIVCAAVPAGQKGNVAKGS
jgi:hypothetical protein